MSLEIGGASTGSTYPSWWDEEERKRRERLGIPGAPIEPVKQQTPEQQWKQQERDYANNPRSVIDNDAQQAIKYLSDFNGPEGKQMGSVEEYFKLANNMGEEKLRDRIQAIKYIWDTFLPNVDGTSAVWELVKSPYDLQQITAMAREGALSDFARQKDREKAKYDLGMSYFGHDQMMAKHYVTYGDQTVSPTQRLGQFASENPVEALMLAATTLLPMAGAVPGVLGKIITTAGVLGGTGVGMMQYGSATQGARSENARSQRPIFDTSIEEPDYLKTLMIRPLLKDDDPLAKKFDQVRSINAVVYESGLEGGELDALKQWVTTELIDPYTGEVVLPAEDIEDMEDGYLTYDVANALLSRAAKVRNQEFDFKIELVERGFQANNSPDFTQSLSSEEWKPALDKYNQHMIEQANAWDIYPAEAAFRDARGYEWTSAGRTAAREALLSTGVLNVPFNYGFQLITDFGGVQEALGARADFATRANRDEVYQTAQAAFRDYVMESYMGEGKRYSSYDPWEPSHVNQVMHLVRLDLMEGNGDWESDAELVRLNAALAQEEMRLIKGDEGYYGKDYIATMARVFGADPAAWEKMRREKPGVVSLTNALIDTVGAFSTPPLWRSLRGGTVGSSASAFMQDSRATARLGRAAGYIDNGDLQGAAQVLGDTQAARDLVLGANKWANAVKDGSAYTRMADEIFKLAQKGDDTSVSKLFVGERSKEIAARIGEYVRTKGASEASLRYFERQVQPGADAFGGVQRMTAKAQAAIDNADNGSKQYGIGRLRAIAKENDIKVPKGATADDIVLLLKTRQAELRRMADESLVPAHMPFGGSDTPSVKVGYLTAAERRPLVETTTTGTQWGPVAMPSGIQLQEQAVKGKIAQWLSNEQNVHGTIFGSKPVEEALRVQAAYAWTQGKNIMPELRFTKVGDRAYVKVAIDNTIAKVKNDFLRKTLTELTKWYHREPQEAVDLAGPEAMEIVHDWVLVATGDARLARDMASKAMRVKGPAAARALEAELAKVADQFLERRKIAPTLAKSTGGAESMMGLKPAPNSTGKVLTYKTRAGEPAQVPVDTAMSKYTVNLGKDIMWAPYRVGTVDADAALIVRGMQQTRNMVTHMRNLWRTVTRLAYAFNAPLRNTAVGAGAPVLFMKHAVADTPRSLLAGVPVVNFRAVSKSVDNILTKVAPDAAEYVRYMRHRGEFTGQQYLSAVGTRWVESAPYGKSRNPFKRSIYSVDRVPQNLEATSDMLRRIGQSKVFKAWSKGGADEARKWYLSAEGKSWMKQEGYYRAFRADYGGPSLKGKALDEAVADWATQQYVFGYLEELRAAAPHLLDGYDDVAGIIKLAQEGQLDSKKIQNLIKEVGKREPSENLRLGVQKDVGSGGNLVSRATQPFIWGIKKAMIPDRFNRVTVFNHTFNNLWKKMTKEGVDPDQAARTAAEIAYARSEQIHFDMSRAMEWETKYRGYAWFLADSRIYLQYWLKIMAQSPTLAGAVTSFNNWMEERNKSLDLPDWQKYNITVPVGNGNHFVIDPAIYFWFTVYSAESLAGHGLERGALAATNAVLGTGIEPAPMDFGFNVTRFDELGKAMFRAVDSPLGMRGFVPFKDVADWNIPEQEWVDWMKKQTPAYREKMSRETHKRMALAELNGKPITWSDAMAQVLVSNLARQSYRFLRPSSTRIITDAELQYNDLMKRLDEAKTPEAKEALIDQNPALLNIMGMSTDPWTQEELDEYRTRYFDAQDKLAADLDRLYDEGKIMDKEAVDACYKEFEAVRETLKGESEEFRNWMTATKTEELEKAIGYLMPDVDAEMFIRQNQPPDPERKLYVEQVSQENFEEALKKYGVGTDDTDSPLYKLLKDFYVTQPRNAMLGPQDDVTKRQVSVARYLGRGGEAGVFRKDRYLQMVNEQHLRELVGAGLTGANANMNNPMMSNMSLGQKEAIGWNTDPKSEEGWWRWAVEHHKYSKIIQEQVPGGSKTSKAGKAVWAQFEAWVEKYKGENPGWGKEYEFSAKPLVERLRELGIGEGTDDLSLAWNGFLDLATEYREALEVLGVNSGTITSAEVDTYYTGRLADYAREHEEWWRSFRNTFTLTKFGWKKRLEGTVDDFLWEGEDAEGVS